MNSDVRLDGDTLRLDARVVACSAHDLLLDHPARREEGATSELRRALVHGPGDQLVLNWGEDYPGGTSVSGDLEVTGEITTRRIHGVKAITGEHVCVLNAQGGLAVHGWDLQLDDVERRSGNDTIPGPFGTMRTPKTYRRALVHGHDDRLVLNWGGDYSGGVRIEGEVGVGGPLTVTAHGATVDLVAAVQELQQTVAAQETTIAALQAKLDALGDAPAPEPVP